MLRRISRTKYKIFAFDVESHNDDESIAKEETSVWLWSCIDENSKPDDEGIYGNDIYSFLDKLEALSDPPRKHGEKKREIKNVAVYIFNLAFEWSFIFPALLERGFTWREKFDLTDAKVFHTTANKTCASVWEAELKFTEKGGIVKLRDLGKIFQGKLADIAKSFNLEVQKGSIDYKLNRLHGNDGKGGKWVPTEEEKIYCYKDVKIVMSILEEMDKRDDKDFWNSISASSYAMRKMIKYAYPKAKKPYLEFRKHYPPEIGEEAAFLRKTVAGGITYALPSWQYVDIKKRIAHWDMRQAHPTSAYLNVFPYGEGTYFQGEPPESSGYRISACHIRISYIYAKVHSVIKLIGLDIAQNVEIWVWSFEIPLLYRCYDGLRVEYIDGYQYKVKWLPWRNFYRDNFIRREKAKIDGDAFLIQQCKLWNNSSYGKLLERPHTTVLENYLDAEGLIDSVEHEKAEPPTFSKYTLLKVGSCIPAYTRVRLVETALLISNGGAASEAEFNKLYPKEKGNFDSGNDIVYFDTDSIFFIENERTLEGVKKLNTKKELGGWGKENDITRGMFTAPKRYKIVEEEENEEGQKEEKTVVHAAGLNFRDAPEYDIDLIRGDFQVQGRKRVRGGTLIVMKEKKLQVQEKYKAVFEKNKNKV